MRFCVEYISKIGTQPYVFRRQLDPGDFQFAFELHSDADSERFAIGQVVDLDGFEVVY